MAPLAACSHADTSRRRTCAEAVDEEIFEQFAMFHQAGLPDFAFMNKVPRSALQHAHKSCSCP
jgi:hypothetical protein